VKQLRDSWDDLYWDVKAPWNRDGSSARRRGSLRATGGAAPKLADAAVRNGDTIAVITTDVHTATDAFVKPKPTIPTMKAPDVIG
jgi:hypothetical protein